MTTDPPMPVSLVKVRGTELLASDTAEQYRQKIARITLDSMVQFVGLLDARGTVLDINHVALRAVGIQLSDVEGKPFWSAIWWQVSEEVNRVLRESVLRASQGEFVRWETEIYGRAAGQETIIIDASLMPVTDEQGRVVFITAEGRDITDKKAHERQIARQREELAQLDQLKTQLFADTSPAILWITESDSSCSFISRGWFDYTGQNEEAALGFGWIECVHPDDREVARRTILEATQNREPLSLDFRLRRADGEFRWALSSGRPRFNPAGAFDGFTGSVIDIHERKQAAQASAVLSAIVDSSDDAIISKDLCGTIMSWNQAAERLFGYTAAEAIGQSILMLIPPDRQEEEPQILARLQRGERVDHFETIRIRKDGSLLNISLTISPMKDADGRIIGASKIARDISERVRQERALQEANAALKQANDDLQQFAYSASHDLQEPLRMVAAYSQLLKAKFGDKLGPEGDEYIGHTVQGALRMEGLLRDLRIYTQVSMADREAIEETDAGEVLKQALLNLEVAIKDSGASISYTALPQIRMHEFQLGQVFQNLIANAIRYRSEKPPRLHIAAERQGEHWLFSVQDNGIGIEPQFQEQIFGLFKRLHSAAQYPGTGMGLAICQRIIERSGGRIWVESEPGKGSIFYFTIPAIKVAPLLEVRTSPGITP
jgi:PAS domain S-box-containing protein